MPVLVPLRRRLAAGFLIASLVVLPAAAAAASIAKTPTISGNAWVALVVIAVLVGTIFLLIMGALQVERRDAAFGRGRRHNNGWYGIFPAAPYDDDETPDYHQFGDADDGGGEGG